MLQGISLLRGLIWRGPQRIVPMVPGVVTVAHTAVYLVFAPAACRMVVVRQPGAGVLFVVAAVRSLVLLRVGGKSAELLGNRAGRPCYCSGRRWCAVSVHGGAVTFEGGASKNCAKKPQTSPFFAQRQVFGGQRSPLEPHLFEKNRSSLGLQRSTLGAKDRRLTAPQSTVSARRTALSPPQSALSPPQSALGAGKWRVARSRSGLARFCTSLTPARGSLTAGKPRSELFCLRLAEMFPPLTLAPSTAETFSPAQTTPSTMAGAPSTTPEAYGATAKTVRAVPFLVEVAEFR
jgi:hypothetical protein